MKNSGSRFYLSQTPVPKMPPGLVDLMEGMTKEVLKRNPTDVYEFCAVYMRTLLEIRDGVVQEQSSPLKMRQAKVQNQHELGPERYPGTCKEKNTLINNNTFKENFIPVEELKVSSEKELKQNNFKISVRHEMDVMQASEIEIAQVFINSKTIEKFTPATMFENDNVSIADENHIKKDNTDSHCIVLPNRLELNDDSPIDIKETNVDVTTKLAKNTDETELVLHTDKMDEMEVVEGNQSNTDYPKIIDEQSMQAVVTDEMDMSGKDEINVTNLLQEEIKHQSTQNDIPEYENITKTYPLHLNATEGPLKESSMDQISKSHNVNDLHSINEENKNVNIDSDLASIDEVQKTKEKQIVEYKNVIIESNLASIDEVQTTKEKQLVEYKNVIIDSNLASIDEVRITKETQLVEHKNVITDSNLPSIHEVQKTKEKQFVEHENVIIDSNLASIDEVRMTKETQLVEHEKVITESNLASIDEVQKTKEEQLVDHKNVIIDSNLASIDKVQKTKEKQLVEHENVILFSNSASIDEVQKTKEKQLVKQNDTAKENKSGEVKVTNELYKLKNVDHNLIEKQGNLSSESKEDLNNCTILDVEISKGEAILLNNIVCDNTDLQQDLRDNNSEELHSNLYSQNDHEGQKVSDNEEFKNLEIISDTSNNDVDQLISAQNINVSDVNKQIIQETSDIAPTNSNEISLDNNVVLEKSNSRHDSKKSLENVNESSNMDLETAAITIQKVFRSFLYKSRGSTFEDVGNDEIVLNNKDMDIYTGPNNERSLGITRIDSVLQTVNEEKSLSLSTDDSSTLSSAATTIQAHVRGFLVRNKMNSSKTLSMNSLINSDSYPVTSSDDGDHQQKNKTVLNIHIVPEAENKSFSRDETVITSVDLSLDCSPPTSINLHPLGYDKSEPRKQLKREDAFQSISPPSNNSRKLSEDIESVRGIYTNDKVHKTPSDGNDLLKVDSTEGHNNGQVVNLESNDSLIAATSKNQQQKGFSTKISSDELDVVTPFVKKYSDQNISADDINSKLIHSGEFHDVLVPTNVARNDTSVVRGE